MVYRSLLAPKGVHILSLGLFEDLRTHLGLLGLLRLKRAQFFYDLIKSPCKGPKELKKIVFKAQKS